MILSLVKRNLKLFFRDRVAVFFSLLGVFIIIGLYVIFLGKMMTDYTEHVLGENASFLMTSWIMAGVISVTTLTTCMGAFGIMVEDNASNRMRDFKVSPIRRSILVLSYVVSAMIVAVVMSIITLIVSEFYIYFNGGEFLSFQRFLQTFGLIMVSVFASSSLVFFVVAFIKSLNAFSTASSIVGSLIGFLTGIYIPIGNLPSGVQTLIKIFPLSHSGVLLRQVMMSQAVDLEYVPDHFKEFVGLNFSVNGEFLSNFVHMGYLLLSGVLFYGLAIWVFSRKRSK